MFGTFSPPPTKTFSLSEKLFSEKGKSLCSMRGLHNIYEKIQLVRPRLGNRIEGTNFYPAM